MTHTANNFWKRIPFLKLLLPLIAGIIIQHYFPLRQQALISLFLIGLLIICIFNFSSLTTKFSFWFVFPFAAWLIFFSLGARLIYQQTVYSGLLSETEPNKQYQWAGIVDEPPIKKPRSLKAEVSIQWICTPDSLTRIDRKVIAYFHPKDSASLKYGARILSNKSLREIRNSGNPASFDYKQYCQFQGITHQVFLQPEDYKILPAVQNNRLHKFIFGSRASIVAIIKKYIKGKKETGLAEALLIGYKDDLDKTLVQSYANTGVVHIIAISGLHLGMIYWLLGVFLNPIRSLKGVSWLSPFLIITGLWFFTLMAGAQPSILRSAVMFSCIVIGKSLSRRSSIFNTMAVSAFILLCINPYWLWDAGFQLSYAAVLSILIFMKPVYNLIQLKNKVLDACWKLNAVTISAQILTVPFCIYHFNQFPNLFMLTNFVAVPLSSLILFGEIFLCAVAFIPAIANLIGTMLTWSIGFMNSFITHIETIPFSAWTALSINFFQAIMLMIIIVSFTCWLWYKSTTALKLTITSLAAFVAVRTTDFIGRSRQKLLIVYNISGKSAIDLINGRRYKFFGDHAILSDLQLVQFHLEPSRTLHRVTKANKLPGTVQHGKYLRFGGRRLLMLNENTNYRKVDNRVPIDLLIISGSLHGNLEELPKTLVIGMVVLDGSVSAAVAKRVRAVCDKFNMPIHEVKLNGAFVMKER